MLGHIALQCKDALSWQSPHKPPRPGTCVSAPGLVSPVTQSDQNQRGFFPLMRGKSTALKSVRPRFRSSLLVVFCCCVTNHHKPSGLQAPLISLQFCRGRLAGGVQVGSASSLLSISPRLSPDISQAGLLPGSFGKKPHPRAFRWLAESSSWWPDRCEVPLSLLAIGGHALLEAITFLLMWSLHLPSPHGVLFTLQSLTPSLLP